jgi:hypothetical protein
MVFRIVFWVVLPCKIIVDRRFRGAYRTTGILFSNFCFGTIVVSKQHTELVHFFMSILTVTRFVRLIQQYKKKAKKTFVTMEAATIVC